MSQNSFKWFLSDLLSPPVKTWVVSYWNGTQNLLICVYVCAGALCMGVCSFVQSPCVNFRYHTSKVIHLVFVIYLFTFLSETRCLNWPSQQSCLARESHRSACPYLPTTGISSAQCLPFGGILEIECKSSTNISSQPEGSHILSHFYFPLQSPQQIKVKFIATTHSECHFSVEIF